MSVKSWMAAAMIVGVLGLGVEIPTPTVGQTISQLSIKQELAEAKRLNQQVAELYQQGKYEEAIPLAEQALERLLHLSVEDFSEESSSVFDLTQGIATILNNLSAIYAEK